jgi:NADH-quinone oxidoreductase subunit I
MPYGIGILKGMMVTMANFLRKPSTVQYPETRLKQHPRFRGEDFVWYEERCTGCASCAKYCPLGIIKIVTSGSGSQISEGEKYKLETFDIELARCMFCGLCVEACPYDALHLGSGFERARERKSDLVIPLEELRSSPKRPSTWFRPQLEKKNHNPFEGQTTTWSDVARPAIQDPDYEDMNKRWVDDR